LIVEFIKEQEDRAQASKKIYQRDSFLGN
jgi:hypothetical protein